MAVLEKIAISILGSAIKKTIADPALDKAKKPLVERKRSRRIAEASALAEKRWISEYTTGMLRTL